MMTMRTYWEILEYRCELIVEECGSKNMTWDDFHSKIGEFCQRANSETLDAMTPKAKGDYEWDYHLEENDYGCEVALEIGRMNTDKQQQIELYEEFYAMSDMPHFREYAEDLKREPDYTFDRYDVDGYKNAHFKKIEDVFYLMYGVDRNASGAEFPDCFADVVPTADSDNPFVVEGVNHA